MFNWIIQHSPIFYFTQSLWRDEVFSILAAEKPLLYILPKLGFEPPLYYTLLHFWMKIFGDSEIAARSLSLLGFALATIVVIEWADKLFRKHWLAWFLPLFFFLNPMLIYYAFEVRTYGWYMFFAILSFYAYMEKKWKLLILANVLGFYTHAYMIFIPLVEGIHWCIATFAYKIPKKVNLKSFITSPFLVTIYAFFFLTSFWIYKIIIELPLLKQSWYFPVNVHLILSVIGNMFIGYEGTPWFLWQHTMILSGILIAASVIALIPKKTRLRNLFFVLASYAPLCIVIGVSFVKPLFVNRYLIHVSIALVFTIILAIETVVDKKLQIGIALIFLCYVVGFNMWYPEQHPKFDFRSVLAEVNKTKNPNDLIYAISPLIFFETEYYSTDRSKVFLYNTSQNSFPWYIGGAVFSEKQMKSDLPNFPTRAYLVQENGTVDVLYKTDQGSINTMSPVK
jgi:mannosyltransferase